MIDSHCHLDFAAFDGDRADVVRRAREAGVEAVLVPGVDEAQWRRAERLAVGATLWRAVGVHPQAVDATPVDAVGAWIDRLDVVAIGELGWDAHVEASIARQDAVADAQIALARERRLPVILHVVGAHGHAIERLERHGALRGVVHAYSGSAELLVRYLRLGLHVSFGPSVTRPNARRPREAAAEVPLDRLLLETDGPDQHPPDARRGEPADVVRVAEAVAEARGAPLDAVVAAADANARRLFSR